MKLFKIWPILFLMSLSILMMIQPLFANEAFDRKLEQGVLYLKKNMYVQAKEELLPLYEVNAGKQNFLLLISLAKISYQLYQMTEAFQYLKEAKALDHLISNEIKEIKEVEEEWEKQYGSVSLQSANPQTIGTLTLKSTSTLINQHKKSVVQETSQNLQNKVQLPTVIYLPYGSYMANQTPFTLTLNQPSPVVEVILNPLPKSAQDQSKTWLYVGIGSGVAIALGLGLYFLLQQDETQTKQPYDISVAF